MILVLESSTTSAKAMLFDPEKGVVKVESEAYPACCYESGGTGLHNAGEIFRQTAALGKHICTDQQIELIVPCGTWHNLLLCDETMEPSSPAYTWTYNGAAQVAGELRQSRQYTKEFYQKTGCMVHSIYPAFKLLELKRQGADLTHSCISSQSTYMFYKLTGKRATTDCLASGAGLLNVHTRDWDDDILKQIGIDRRQLGQLTSYREPQPLNDSGAALLGVSAGTPVLPPYPDGALNQVGAGALEEGVMTFSVGTSGALRLSSPSPLLPEDPSTWCYLSPNQWLSGAATSGACNCVDWAKNLFFPGATYSELERQPVDLSSMPIFLPFLFGERCPGWNDEMRGGFAHLLPQHKLQDLYLSIQEGVLFNLYQCYLTLCQVNGVPKVIQLSGGITNSKRWTQMCSDIFGRTMICAEVPHMSMVGGAVLALETGGYLKRIEDYRIEPGETIQPDEARHQIYQQRFARYKETYFNNVEQAVEPS